MKPTDGEPDPKLPMQEAERALSEFLRRCNRGEALEFDQFCAGHPQESELRFLRSACATGRVDQTSASFRALLEDIGGEDAAAGFLETTGPADPLREPGSRGDTGPLPQASPEGKYLHPEKIAEGGMGAIYRVFDRNLHRTLAMKVIKEAPGSRDGSGGRSEERSRFLDEAYITAQLDHPGIIPVHELGIQPGDRAYFTMALVKGRSLGSVFSQARERREGWNLSRALGALVKVCQTVAYAHSKGIIHRDLKPANVMVGEFGQVYVLDWGLAKRVEQKDRRVPDAPADEAAGASDEVTPHRELSGGTAVTLDGAIIGTPAYMSPEQAEGKIEKVDRLSDVYALGAMLYELLSGRIPYLDPEARLSPRQFLARVLEGPPPPVRRLDPLAPAELVAICEKAMARRREERYTGCLELAEDLQAFLDNRVVRAYESGLWARLKKWSYRHRVVLSVALVLAASFPPVYWMLRNRQGAELVRQGEEFSLRYRRLGEEIPALENTHKEIAVSFLKREPWAPPWRRREEIFAQRKLEQTRDEIESCFNLGVERFSSAVNAAFLSPVRLEAGKKLEDLYQDRRQRIQRGEEFRQSADFYKSKILSLGLGTYSRELEGMGTVQVQTEPAGAEIYCFRYENTEEEFWAPLAFNPASGRVVGRPILRVERILDAAKHQSLFQPGDLWLSVNKMPLQLQGDLAKALEGTGPDQEAIVELERSGKSLELRWIPFPAAFYLDADAFIKPGVLDSCGEQFGLLFEAYPLQFSDACLAGVTAGNGLLELSLPLGSYLLVLRKPGWRDVRFPLILPWHEEGKTVSIRLLREESIPPGFIYVPAGSFFAGGDPRASQGLEKTRGSADGFFISRLEVTVSEYLDFLNDPRIEERLDEEGEVEPVVEEVRKSLEERKDLKEKKIFLIRGFSLTRTSNAYFERKPPVGAWGIAEKFQTLLKPGSPVPGVSQLAAMEFAHWRTLKAGNRWTFRLPTDLEWEKAARGVDRRIFVWGNYFFWSSSHSFYGALSTTRIPIQTGLYPLDESVYGVRDMEGSMSEFTADRINEYQRFIPRRGGNWYTPDEVYFRAATRNGLFPENSSSQDGIRLAASLNTP